MARNHTKTVISFIISVVVILAVLTSAQAHAELPANQPLNTMSTSADNLLSNPGLNGDYYNPAHSNHFVAVDWTRWIIPGTWVPEFVDTPDWYGGPIAAFEGDNSQRWHSWNGEYKSGLYQVVENIEPCTLYQFTMWSRKSPSPTTGIIEHHIGIDPYGTEYAPSIDDPYTAESSLANVVWSADHNLLGVWEQLSVSTESISSKLSAVMFSKSTRPDNGIYTFDSFYDAGTLMQIPFPDGKLPAPAYWSPDGVITNINIVTTTTQITINWQTTVPASTQVWYEYMIPTTGSPAETQAYTLYSPVVHHSVNPTLYSYASDVDTTPTTSHSVILTGLPAHARVVFVPLSRHVSGSECVTSGYRPLTVALP